MKPKHILYIAGGYLVLAYVAGKAGYTLPLNLLSKVLP